MISRRKKLLSSPEHLFWFFTLLLVFASICLLYSKILNHIGTLCRNELFFKYIMLFCHLQYSYRIFWIRLCKIRLIFQQLSTFTFLIVHRHFLYGPPKMNVYWTSTHVSIQAWHNLNFGISHYLLVLYSICGQLWLVLTSSGIGELIQLNFSFRSFIHLAPNDLIQSFDKMRV